MRLTLASIVDIKLIEKWYKSLLIELFKHHCITTGVMFCSDCHARRNNGFSSNPHCYAVFKARYYSHLMQEIVDYHTNVTFDISHRICFKRLQYKINQVISEVFRHQKDLKCKKYSIVMQFHNKLYDEMIPHAMCYFSPFPKLVTDRILGLIWDVKNNIHIEADDVLADLAKIEWDDETLRKPRKYVPRTKHMLALRNKN